MSDERIAPQPPETPAPASPAAPVGTRRKSGRGAVDMVVRGIVSGLYEGRYVPGQRLVEADLAATFGVGRSTVREALAQLTAEGIVRLNPNRGAAIHRLGRAEADEILVLLEALTALTARLAASNVGKTAETERFSAALDGLMAFENAAADAAFHRARNEYFRALASLAGNERLRRVLRGLNVHLLRVQWRHFQVEGDIERFEDYRAMGEAILSGDASRAETAGRRYIHRVSEAVARLPARVFAD